MTLAPLKTCKPSQAGQLNDFCFGPVTGFSSPYILKKDKLNF